MELEYKQGVHRGFSATSNGETGEFEYGSLEIILSRENLLIAMKRVISNKGSHGVDGMTVYELKHFLIIKLFQKIVSAFTIAEIQKGN